MTSQKLFQAETSFTNLTIQHINYLLYIAEWELLSNILNNI